MPQFMCKDPDLPLNRQAGIDGDSRSKFGTYDVEPIPIVAQFKICVEELHQDAGFFATASSFDM